MSLLSRLLNVLRSERVSRELERELDFHVAERAEELIASGMPAAQARREAERRLGNRVLQKERTRDVDVLMWLDTVLADVRYALRALRNAPGFAAVAILSLALGIGANTAIFSLIDAAVLKPLPVREPEQLVQVALANLAAPSDGATFTNPLWEQLRDRQQVFAGIAAYSEMQFNLSSGGVARPIRGNLVSGDFFTMLGVGPAIGRVLSRSDDYRGCPGVAVLGAGFWRSEYGSSPDVVGRTLRLSGKPFEIVGVAAESFHGATVGRSMQAYVPLCAEAVIAGERSGLDMRSRWFLQVLGRPQPGILLESVNAHLAKIAPAAYAATVPEHHEPADQAEYLKGAFSAEPAASGQSDLRDRYSSALMVLMMLVGVVLLIACANVANLMLARAAARQREINVRLAIGAGRSRIVRQLLTESLVIALLSALLGILIAIQGSRALVSLLSTTTNQVSLQLPLDVRVLGFTLAVAACAAILFGLAPAWRAGRSEPQSALRAASRGVIEGHSRFNTGKLLVVAQIALSLALVVSAGLLVGTFRRLSTDPSGFDRSGVVLVSVNLPEDIDSFERQRVLFGTMLEGIRALPGVESASLSQITPISRLTWNDDIYVAGHSPASERDRVSLMNEVSDRYFTTLGTRILAGREFHDRDTPGAPLVAVVNEAFARHYFGVVNVVGREFRVTSAREPALRIVGVVETAKYQSLREKPQRTAYVPWSQSQERAFTMTFELRTRADAAQLVQAVSGITATAHPSASLRVTTLDQQLSDSLTRERILALLSGTLGALALLLAMIGLYGIMAYNVARRRSEIGIRMALGSARSRVIRMVVGEGGWMIGAGLVLGTMLAIAGTRFVQSFLYGLSRNDATTLVASAALLGIAGLAACALPAWRASRVEPLSALRVE